MSAAESELSTLKEFLERLELINHIILHGTKDFKDIINKLNKSNDKLIKAMEDAGKALNRF